MNTNTLLVSLCQLLFALRSAEKDVLILNAVVAPPSAVPFSAGLQFSAVKMACHGLVLERVEIQYSVIMRAPSLVRLVSSGKTPHY